jgi:hypothetical protein
MSLRGFAQVITEYLSQRQHQQVEALKTGLETRQSCTAAGAAQAYDLLSKDIPILLANFEKSLLDQGIDPELGVVPEVAHTSSDSASV